MKDRIRLFVINWLFWYLLFIVARIAFLLYQFRLTSQLTPATIAGTFIHGFFLDLSMASYLMVVPAILILLSTLFNFRLLPVFLKTYTFAGLLISVSIILIDMVLYSFWEFRLDTTPLFYMGNLQAMTASVSIWLFILGILGILIVTIALYRVYLMILRKFRFSFQAKIISTLPIILLTGLVAFGIRGGIGVGAVSIGWAYFSQNTFANHAAINPVWNVAFSLTEKDDLNRKYEIFDNQEATVICDSLYSDHGQTRLILRNQHPNIILVIVESFTAKAIGALGGVDDITPKFDSLVHEGILFDHVYAASDRTDKGLAAVLAGYPSLPGSSPLKFPQKTDNIPSFPRYLTRRGYANTFYYGGSLDFANYRSFLVQAGFKKLVTRDDFDASTFGTKWGAWDHLVFKRLLDDTPDADSNFFKTILTLTSHEPFAIPVPPLKNGTDKETLYLNSLHYTDNCIGSFIAEAKKRSWWQNTLIVITADHGSMMPGHDGVTDLPKYHIPVLLTGGALSVKDTIIHTVCGQTDIARTLLEQLGISGKDFPFSRNILTSAPTAGAFFTYSGGTGYYDGKELCIYNTAAKEFSEADKISQASQQRIAKAILQHLYDDFSKR
jgi:phosphoglycerol transferase MdoB-like AlkP superfamily enzyme